MFFGFSLGKLIVLIAIVVAVWYGFKIFARKSDPPRPRRRVGKRARKDAGTADPEAIDTVYDPETDTYVPRRDKTRD